MYNVKKRTIPIRGGGGSNSEYLITVQSLGFGMPSALGYTKDFDESNLISSIYPNNIIIVNGQPCEVLGLYTTRAGTIMRPKNVTSLFIDYEHNSSIAIHVGRNDTKQYFGTLLADGSTGEFTLFTNADVMQAIPVYLSATTPPLMRKSCNAISFEVAA